MLERRRDELKLVQIRYGDVEAGPSLDWVIVQCWPLPSGWNKSATAILVQIPSGYAITPPDNFYADNDLRLANGAAPGNTNLNYAFLDRQWMQFSYHVEAADWRPHADLLQGHNLLTFLLGVANRLAEAN
jgi:Prokaryotic E2 family E